MALFLLLAILAVVLGIVGVTEGLMYLLIIGIAVLVLDVAFFGVRWFRRAHPAR
ncbi:hypothetical protein ABZ070_07265 [Streptomyces sp. NPDC006283]|uniref:hypothetical protein n=1 Tax=Streptomyces sp. NPDC006283 TaxID=3156741 RepID=UPI0033B4E64A